MSERRTPAAPAHAIHLHTSLPLPSAIGQIDGLQILRAAAVVLVAWLHTDEMVAGTTHRALPTLGIVGIDIFFVISGFIMSTIVLRAQTPPGPKTAWEFLKRRLIRIFPIYWVFALLTAIRLLLRHQLFQYNFFASVFLLPLPNAPRLFDASWTMMFEMFFYYMMSAILLLTVRRAVPTAVALLCVLTFAGAFVHNRGPVWVIVCNPILLEFVFGALAALVLQRTGRRRGLGVALLLLGTAGTFALLALPIQTADSMAMILTGQAIGARVATWGLASGCVVAGMVLWSPAIRTLAGRVALVLGNASYSVYLASVPVIEYAWRFIRGVQRAPEQMSPAIQGIQQLFVVAATLALGWACYQWVEWPLVRRLQARFTHSAPSIQSRVST